MSLDSLDCDALLSVPKSSRVMDVRSSQWGFSAAPVAPPTPQHSAFRGGKEFKICLECVSFRRWEVITEQIVQCYVKTKIWIEFTFVRLSFLLRSMKAEEHHNYWFYNLLEATDRCINMFSINCIFWSVCTPSLSSVLRAIIDHLGVFVESADWG